MIFAPIILDFSGREEALTNIKRYEHEITRVMFYRTNDLIHSRRVSWHVESAIEDILSIYKGFNVDYTRTLANVHDDLEIITGDVQLHDKEKMNDNQKEDLVKKEKEAIPTIIKMYNSIANGFSYEELLIAAKEKNSLEAQFVSFFDKFDGAGEAWHEVFAGNPHFLRPAGGLDHNGGYVRRLREFPKKYPLLNKFFEKFPEYLPEPIDFKSIVEKSSPHTIKSIKINTDYPLYERWKNNVIKNEGLGLLTNQIEFIG